MKILPTLAFTLTLAATAALPASGAFSISLNLIPAGGTGVGFSGYSASQVAIMNDAAAAWESIITGYQPGITVTGVTIGTFAANLGGPGGTLAGSSQIAGTNASQAGFILATQGQMIFDSSDLTQLETNGLLDDVFMHEMAHVLGVGTLWDDNGLYVNGSGQYTGAAGLAAYQKEFDPLATFVPVELDFGTGAADVHWNEAGAGAPAVVDPTSPNLGGSLNDELMTSFVSGSNFLSATTLGSLQDLGFTVIPEPGVGILGILGLAGLALRRRRA